MRSDLFEQTNDLTPRQMFLYAFDDAIRATVKSLSDIGLDQEAIWTAFSDSLDLIYKNAAAVQSEASCDDYWQGAKANDPSFIAA